jgi:putative ABC transport system permease protein
MKSILANKMRAFLTMLGIIIGVASVITLIGLVDAMKTYIINSFSDMGTNMLTVSATNSDTRSVNLDFMYELVDDHPDVFDGVTPKVTGSFTVKNGTNSLTNKTVTGVDESYLDINHLTLLQGRFINYADTLSRNKVCVLGSYYVEELFETNNILGAPSKLMEMYSPL